MDSPLEPEDEFEGAVPPGEFAPGEFQPGPVPPGMPGMDRHVIDWASGEAQTKAPLPPMEGDPTVDPGSVPRSEMPPPEPPKVAEAPKEFPKEHRLAFTGLMYLGYLTDSFRWMGHEFSIRTLTEDELLEVALLHEQWAATIGANKAYQMAMVAASLVSVDGQPMPQPLGGEVTGERFQARFNIVRKWFPPTTRVLYARFLKLEERVDEVMKAMGEAQG